MSYRLLWQLICLLCLQLVARVSSATTTPFGFSVEDRDGQVVVSQIDGDSKKLLGKMEVGDTLLKLDHQEITSIDDLPAILRSTAETQTTSSPLTYERDGKKGYTSIFLPLEKALEPGEKHPKLIRSAYVRCKSSLPRMPRQQSIRATEEEKMAFRSKYIKRNEICLSALIEDTLSDNWQSAPAIWKAISNVNDFLRFKDVEDDWSDTQKMERLFQRALVYVDQMYESKLKFILDRKAEIDGGVMHVRKFSNAPDVICWKRKNNGQPLPWLLKNQFATSGGSCQVIQGDHGCIVYVMNNQLEVEKQLYVVFSRQEIVVYDAERVPNALEATKALPSKFLQLPNLAAGDLEMISSSDTDYKDNLVRIAFYFATAYARQCASSGSRRKSISGRITEATTTNGYSEQTGRVDYDYPVEPEFFDMASLGQKSKTYMILGADLEGDSHSTMTMFVSKGCNSEPVQNTRNTLLKFWPNYENVIAGTIFGPDGNLITIRQ